MDKVIERVKVLVKNLNEYHNDNDYGLGMYKNTYRVKDNYVVILEEHKHNSSNKSVWGYVWYNGDITQQPNMKSKDGNVFKEYLIDSDRIHNAKIGEL